ncbi:type II toxin-antitoxin system HicB family antitoxin [Candidatus Palauibacter sp.]|uniref:type II toxin-antitoxin system HicB family antitoxin n=1 Tax=Candidatus Palauibacter sp. TaxID=3101350 RepID=UPI003B5A478F
MSESDRYMALPYTIEVECDERRQDAFHVARIMELEGCIAQGRTEAEARTELRGAQRLFIETMLDNGVLVPEPTDSRATARRVSPSSPSPA